MAARRIDLEGKRFGRLRVVKQVGISRQNRSILWECVCDCGNIKITDTSHLNSGVTRSCGCLFKEVVSNLKFKHGGTKTREYYVWQGMKHRCFNQNDKEYKNYGGRGITVCDRWRNSFENFLHDMGNVPRGMSIERINNEKNYSPENCKWATRKEQANNKRNNVKLKFGGASYGINDVAELTNINRKCIENRVYQGWTTPEVIFTPYRRKRNALLR